MTNHLWVYGDSFSDDRNLTWPLAPWWPTQLARRLNLQLQCRSVSAGSTETALIRFHEDTSHHRIQPHDVVTFQTSTSGRLHTLYQREHPETAAQYLHPQARVPEHQWYHDNRSHIEWWQTEYDYHCGDIQCEAAISLVGDWARRNPGVRVLILRNQTPTIRLTREWPTNMTETVVGLNDISVGEFAPGVTYESTIAQTQYDPRVNHLTNPNLATLVDILEEMVRTGDGALLDPSKFIRGLLPHIPTRQAYRDLVSRGILAHSINREEAIRA